MPKDIYIDTAAETAAVMRKKLKKMLNEMDDKHVRLIYHFYSGILQSAKERAARQ